MNKILSVKPESGEPGDIIEIELVYEKGAQKLLSTHVFFHDEKSENVTIVKNDSGHMTIHAEVPEDATTGKIEVALVGAAAPMPMEWPKFTVNRITVTRIQPATGPYKRGKSLLIALSCSHINSQAVVKVFFPVTDNAPPTRAVSPPPIVMPPNMVKVKIPQFAHTGQVKVQLNPRENAKTTRLVIAD